MHGMETENEIISKILDPQRLSLPPEPPIVELRWEPYVDHLGDNELHVWAILAESATSEQRRGRQITAASRVIRDALQAAGIKKFAYLRFLKRSEMEEMGIHV
jgi:hypothetical protein